MTQLSLADAQEIIAAALEDGGKRKLQPLSVVVLDARGLDKAVASQDGVSLKRVEVARAKAHGALALGLGSRSLFKRAKEQPFFIASVTQCVGGAGLVPGPGGVLIKTEEGELIGAVGVSGDTSDNDEAVALAGIAAAGLSADPGSD